jgi:hypothetical protein
VNIVADIKQSNFTRNRLNGFNQSYGQDSACLYLDNNQVSRVSISQTVFISDGSVRMVGSSGTKAGGVADFQGAIYSRSGGNGVITVTDSSFTQDN